jgi:hypothetical protein
MRFLSRALPIRVSERFFQRLMAWECCPANFTAYWLSSPSCVAFGCYALKTYVDRKFAAIESAEKNQANVPKLFVRAAKLMAEQRETKYYFDAACSVLSIHSRERTPFQI